MRIAFVCALAILWLAAPAGAWLFAGDVPQDLGIPVQDGGSADMVAAIFAVPSDSYATSFGLALARVVGPAGSGFTVYSLRHSTTCPTPRWRRSHWYPKCHPAVLRRSTPDSDLLAGEHGLRARCDAEHVRIYGRGVLRQVRLLRSGQFGWRSVVGDAAVSSRRKGGWI